VGLAEARRVGTGAVSELHAAAGICFTIRKEDHEEQVEAEYIAPDLLPARTDGETQKRLKLIWDEASPDADPVLTFGRLPSGLMRALIARIGSDAGLAAEY
jgi:internalin A